MHYEKPFSEDSFSSRSAHATATHSYNGVFTGRKSREMSASTNEAFYHEIFRLPGCSIPILDIPEVNQIGNDWDFLKQADYSNIFRGTADCAIQLEDLLPHRQNAQEILRRKGKGKDELRNASATQRKQALSSEPTKQSFNAGIKLSNPTEDQVKDSNAFNRFSEESFASSWKEVVGVGIAADVGDANESFSNQIVTETHSIDSKLRPAENSRNGSGSRDSSIPQHEREGGCYSQRIGNESFNVHDAHVNGFSTNLLEEARFDSASPSAAMESCELDMKMCGTSSFEFPDAANEASKIDIVLENKSSQMFLDKGGTDPNPTRETSEIQTVAPSLPCSKGAEVLSDEKLPDSISNVYGETFPLGDHFTERHYECSESEASEDLLDAVVEENYATTDVPSHEKLDGMTDAEFLNGPSDMTCELSQSKKSESSSEYHSPAFSDEEKDDNSVAAASAAALRKAIEEARATINVAKELMVKTKDGKCLPPAKCMPFSVEESQCKFSNVFAGSLSFPETGARHNRNEQKTASTTTHYENRCFTDMGSSENTHLRTMHISETDELEPKKDLHETTFNGIQMHNDDHKLNSTNRDDLLNFKTFQWNFNASNFKSLEEKETESEGEDTQIEREHEQEDYTGRINEDCTLNNSECLNGNCDTSIPGQCFIKDPFSDGHNEETVENFNVDPLLQNRTPEKVDDKLEEFSSIESRCNEEFQDNTNIENGVNGGEHADVEANCSKLVEKHLQTVPELPESREEESSVPRSHHENRVETDESDWYEETIEGVTVTAELMKEDVETHPNIGSAELREDCIQKLDSVTRMNTKESEPVTKSDERDEDFETSNDFYEAKIGASVERSLHDEDQLQSQEGWFSEDDCKNGVECHVTSWPEECSEEDRDSETFFPEEYGDTRTWLPEGADEDDNASVISSNQRMGDDNSVSDEDFVDNVAENDPDYGSSDEQWGNIEAQPERSSTNRKEERIPGSSFRNAQAEKDEKERSAQAEENEKMKKKELEARRQRIVVERAIKEARERAFAEAAQQFAAKNVASKSQENEDDKPDRIKTKVDNAAKLQSERAAVEKATTAARVRAFEKLLAEMASEKASSQKNNGNAKFDADSSHHRDHNQDLNEGAQSNSSSYWEKLAMEKHQQTAERTAKALAEKNKREQLAKEEQDERHRIAETLDADVKRWARGKERNLRALLSTLQFILGPESGWQPISRNDLVSASAVKKAYIKATLFVHPDKMQQRGATISQKYTCEKVFDLLKEARDKFGKEDN